MLFLTTKFRRLKVNGARENFYLLVEAGNERGKDGRYENIRVAWYGQCEDFGFPKYIVTSFSDGSAVYTNWAAQRLSFKGETPMPDIEVYSSGIKADLTGFLRGEGRHIQFEPWHIFKQEFDRQSDLREAKNRLYDFMGSRQVVIAIDQTGNKPKLVVTHKNEDDGPLIKMAIC